MTDTKLIEEDFNAAEYEKAGEDLGDLVICSLGKITHYKHEAEIDWNLIENHLTLFWDSLFLKRENQEIFRLSNF